MGVPFLGGLAADTSTFFGRPREEAEFICALPLIRGEVTIDVAFLEGVAGEGIAGSGGVMVASWRRAEAGFGFSMLLFVGVVTMAIEILCPAEAPFEALAGVEITFSD